MQAGSKKMVSEILTRHSLQREREISLSGKHPSRIHGENPVIDDPHDNRNFGSRTRGFWNDKIRSLFFLISRNRRGIFPNHS
jgi:hypothetical protein